MSNPGLKYTAEDLMRNWKFGFDAGQMKISREQADVLIELLRKLPNYPDITNCPSLPDIQAYDKAVLNFFRLVGLHKEMPKLEPIPIY